MHHSSFSFLEFGKSTSCLHAKKFWSRKNSYQLIFSENVSKKSVFWTTTYLPLQYTILLSSSGYNHLHLIKKVGTLFHNLPCHFCGVIISPQNPRHFCQFSDCCPSCFRPYLTQDLPIQSDSVDYFCRSLLTVEEEEVVRIVNTCILAKLLNHAIYVFLKLKVCQCGKRFTNYECYNYHYSTYWYYIIPYQYVLLSQN